MPVYLPCDIRGPVSELSTDLYAAWGRSIGRRLEPGADVYVGGDVRISTPEFLSALVSGLCDTGACVHDLGIVPTPLVYFAKRTKAASACAIVTASHSPPDRNGLKWMISNRPPTEDMVADFRREQHESGDFKAAGISVEENIWPDYRTWVRGVAEKLHREDLRILIDPGNGCWAECATALYRKCIPSAHIDSIHDRRDGTFRDRKPDSADPRNLSVLSDTVKRERYDIGLAFDGDGDRIAVVDETGRVLTAEEATSILLSSFGDGISGQPFVHDIKFSEVVSRVASDLGALPVVERSGHAFIRTRMLEENALFGAEISGHYFYRELEGGDDAFYCGLVLMHHLRRTGRTLSSLRADCPEVYMTPDLRIRADAKKASRVFELMRSKFGEDRISTVDGIRLTFPRGWALVRQSVTEPALTFRFEGTSEPDLVQIVEVFCEAVPGLQEEISRAKSHHEEESPDA